MIDQKKNIKSIKFIQSKIYHRNKFSNSNKFKKMNNINFLSECIQCIVCMETIGNISLCSQCKFKYCNECAIKLGKKCCVCFRIGKIKNLELNVNSDISNINLSNLPSQSVQNHKTSLISIILYMCFPTTICIFTVLFFIILLKFIELGLEFIFT
jgi:hypothetical protein